MANVHVCTSKKFVMRLRGDHLRQIQHLCPDNVFFKPGFETIRECTMADLHIALKDLHAPLHALMAPGNDHGQVINAGGVLETVIGWLDTLVKSSKGSTKDSTIYLLPIDMVNDDDEEDEPRR